MCETRGGAAENRQGFEVPIRGRVGPAIIFYNLSPSALPQMKSCVGTRVSAGAQVAERPVDLEAPLGGTGDSSELRHASINRVQHPPRAGSIFWVQQWKQFLAGLIPPFRRRPVVYCDSSGDPLR